VSKEEKKKEIIWSNSQDADARTSPHTGFRILFSTLVKKWANIHKHLTFESNGKAFKRAFKRPFFLFYLTDYNIILRNWQEKPSLINWFSHLQDSWQLSFISTFVRLQRPFHVNFVILAIMQRFTSSPCSQPHAAQMLLTVRTEWADCACALINLFSEKQHTRQIRWEQNKMDACFGEKVCRRTDTIHISTMDG